MAITFFGYGMNPTTDPWTLSIWTTDPLPITPPSSMQAGDLVYMVWYVRWVWWTINVSATWWQTRESLTYSSEWTTNAKRAFRCIFNGTWSANPSMIYWTAWICTTWVLIVFRPTSPTNTWWVDVSESNWTYTAPSYVITIWSAGIITTKPSTVTIAFWWTNNDAVWGNLTWTWRSKTSLLWQYRNQAWSDTSITFAYNIQSSAGTLNSVSQEQTSATWTSWITSYISFYEEAETTNTNFLALF